MTKCLESVSDLDKGRKWHGCRQTDREEKVCARCVICVTRTWAERIHIMDIDDMWYLPNDTSNTISTLFRRLIFRGWLTIDDWHSPLAEQDGFCMRAAIKGIWVVLHDVLRCGRHLKSSRRRQVPYSSQSELWNLRHWQQFVEVSPFISTGSTRNLR